MKAPRHSSRRAWHHFVVSKLLPLLFVGFAALFIGGLRLTHVAEATKADPVQEAWERARAAGSYHFATELIQVTLPSSTITNVGRTSRTDELYLEGENDIRGERLEFDLWSQGGSLVQEGSEISVRVEDGKTWLRQGEGAWQESESNFTEGFAPQGDFMGYLAAMRDVVAHEPEERAGITFTRYAFRIDGPSYALFIRDQMEEALRAKGELPSTGALDVPTYYRDMTGEGELWVGEDGLPLRQLLTLRFPEQDDETVHAQITVDFSQFGTPPLALGEILRSGNLAALGAALGAALPDGLPNVAALLALLPLAAFAALLVRQRRERSFQRFVSVTLIVCIVLGPVLSSAERTSFLQVQAARAATQEAERDESERAQALRELDRPTFNPQVDPVASGVAQYEALARLSNRAAGIAPLVMPNATLLTDDGTDTDGDGLSDFVEERVGTDWELMDSDDDGLADGDEVMGFQFGGRQWYLDPHSSDSNADGRADALEYDVNRDNQPDDTDLDGIPDLFDLDNDGDGVPDRKDLAPLTQATGSDGFSEEEAFHLTINDLEAGKPTLVDFQIRPSNPDHLWYAFNVLDWPWDGDGQIQDVDGATFAEVGSSAGGTLAANDDAGDMKLVPMLEVRMADGANLPTQSELIPYGVGLNELDANGGTVAYVPLAVVVDEETGQRVAFNGRMRYTPAATWGSPHEVRLVWMVQALQDIPCDAENADDVAKGCQPDGFFYNVVRPIHSYYDSWILSGLSVSEEHGASVGMIYEDPGADPDVRQDEALALLSHGLNLAFLGARDQDNNDERDLTIDEIARRFNRTENGTVTEAERWEIPNILRVEQTSYDTFDQAMTFTAMTDTKQLLATAFTTAWQSDNTLQPLLMHVYETEARALVLDNAVVNDGSVLVSADGVTLDMQPDGNAPIPLNIIVGMQWTPYCAPTAATPLWQACSADDYWESVGARYHDDARFLADPDTPTYNQGRLIVSQLYVQTLMRGVEPVGSERQSTDLFALFIAGRRPEPGK